VKYFLFIFLFVSAGMFAQAKKPAAKGNEPQKAVKDSLVQAEEIAADTIDPREIEAKEAHVFAVFGKRAKYAKDKKMRLCINLPLGKENIQYCMVDSFLKEPEVSKILFQKTEGDTTYSLIYLDAFTKAPEKPACDAGHETKLIFSKWNTAVNKATWRVRTISSCMKGVTNMTKSNIADWTPDSPLVVNYYKGQSNFVEAKFDPGQFKLGFQSNAEQ
jgi:hypothetical protein